MLPLATVAVEAPVGLTEAHEYPAAEIPDTPGWSENYWYVGSAPEAEISLFLHCGRAPHAGLWRETVLVHLPCGEILVCKAFGHRAGERAPGASALVFEPLEPWRRWRVCFDGAALRVGPGELDRGLLTDGVYEPVSLDLSLEALSPVWVLDEKVMAAQDWGDLHYQQMMSLRGTVTHGGVSTPLVGNALRDHTRGPRDFLSAVRHVLASCHFPSGRGFFIFDAASDRGRMQAASVLQDGRLHEAELVDPPLLDSRLDAWRPYEFGLEWEGGSTRIQATIVQPIQLGLAGHSEFTIGFDPAVSYCPLFESHTRFVWDDEQGHGWTERTLREHRRR